MPFAVIETAGDGARNELVVVPHKWLRSSKNGSIVLWPNIMGPTEQARYFRDESMCPQKSWLKYKCTVKRYPIGSYEGALRALETLSGETEEVNSPEASHFRERPRSDPETNGSQKKFAVDDSSHLPQDNQNEASINGKTDVTPPTIKNVVLRPNEVPLASTKEENDPFPFIISEVNSENVAYLVNEVPKVEPTDRLVADDPFQKCLDKMNEILGLQHLLHARFDRLEKKVSDIYDQNKSILSGAKNCCKRPSSIEETLSFVFEPMESEQQLAELEKRLEDVEYRTKLMKWLRLNVSGDCAEDRMLGVLDALFSKKFQTMCTWTGTSRKGPKTAVMPNRNILEIFQIIGSGESDEVNQRELANFFMKKLKNSLKRLHLSGIRRSTKRRRRKIQAQQPTDPCDNTNDSSSHSEADPESYTVYIDDSGSSDEDVQLHSAVFSGDVPPSTSENSFNAFSIVKIE